MMQFKKSMIVQVAGAGKGSGKTTVICRLLNKFPNAIAIKSGGPLHSNRETYGDSEKFLDAGASESYYFKYNEREKMLETIRKNRKSIIFLEKNRIMDELTPDLYVFVDRNVDNPRDDRNLNKGRAALIVGFGQEFTDILETRIRELIEKVIES